MTERERWVIYPLLFLALATSLKDKMAPPTTLTIPAIECQELRCAQAIVDRVRAQGIDVVDQNAQPKITMHVLQEQLKPGDDGPPKTISRLDLYGAEGQRALQLAGGPSGGYVMVTHPSQNLHFLLGHEGIGSGLFLVTADGRIAATAFAPEGILKRLLEDAEKPAAPPKTPEDSEGQDKTPAE